MPNLNIDELKEKFSKLSVLVVGDMCIDKDCIGGYSGYSREIEQLPIFRIDSEKQSPGGAGNLAVCFATLGIKTTVAGFWGNSLDVHRHILEQSFRDHKVFTNGMRHAGRTPTFGKLYLHSGQQIYRFDLTAEPIPQGKRESLAEVVGALAKYSDFVACADYEEVLDFGVCSPDVIDAVKGNAKVKFATSRKHIARFAGFDYLMQNEREMQEMIDKDQWNNANLSGSQVVMTSGGKGAGIIYPDKQWECFVESQELTENIDPCGCGDMFYAIYASSVMAGFDTTTCLQLANAGARCVARKLFGTGQADVEELVKEWEYLYGGKIEN